MALNALGWIDFSGYDGTLRQRVVRQFTEAGWDNVSAYKITPGGAQGCTICSKTEATSAPSSHEGRILSHWAHSTIAHPEELWTNVSSNRSVAPTAG